MRIPTLALLLVILSLAPTALAAAPAEELVDQATKAFERGDTAAALTLADKAVVADANNARAYLVRAFLHQSGRDFVKATADYDRAIELDRSNASSYQRRGVVHFRDGNIEESIADFDKYIELEPKQEPYHWQRGISHYYAGRYEDGRKQFESHRSVNPEDVENAVWHYLCVARLEGVEAARRGLIPIKGDTRVPMMQVHAMFAGTATPDDVLAAARAGEPDRQELNGRLFYAHLYIGLFHEAAGEAEKAREHITLAAEKYAAEGYMDDVARVHAGRLKAAAEEKPEP